VKFLLDTHYLLRAANEPMRLPKSVRALIDDHDNELFFSAASLWEVAIKNSRGKHDFQADTACFAGGYSTTDIRNCR
jgi:PIN domain nuclease of toxin-antitoxin system